VSNYYALQNVCRTQERQIGDLREALAAFVDDEECVLDHSGNCQTHLSFGDGECKMVVARRLIAREPLRAERRSDPHEDGWSQRGGER
jgi:hypothetical protein